MKKFCCFLFLIISFSLFSKTVELYAEWLTADVSQISRDVENPNELQAILQETDKRNFTLVFRELKREKALKKYRPFSVKAIKQWFAKRPFPKTTLCKIFFNIPNAYKHLDFSRYPKEKLILFLFEPPTIEPHSYDPAFLENFGRVYTWDDKLVDNQKFFKFYYPVLNGPIPDPPSFQEKKLCTLISSCAESSYSKELYSERENAVRFFEDHPEDFDLYGRNWHKRSYTTYKGTIPNKSDVLKNYRFSICYENTKDVDGYITEKIFDSFCALCVPVYYGASNITQYIPKECFIDKRDFATYEELYAYLKSMTEEEYQTYLQAIIRYTKSKEAQLFTVKNFARAFADALQYALEQP